jgi:hypothetical protein
MNKTNAQIPAMLAIISTLLLSVLACNLPQRAKPDARGTMNAALTEVSAALPVTSTSVSLPADQGSPSETQTPTSTATPELTNFPGPTAASIENNVFAEDLLNRDHVLLASSSVIGPRDFVYSAYLFNNTRIDPIVDEPRTDICRLAIYRLDGNENGLLSSFTGPLYAPNNRYTYPVYCEAINWDVPSQEVLGGGEITPETRALLGLDGYWSDINQNGLPEFAVYYQYCSQGCLDFGAVDVHFYEIKNTYQPTDITADLPGVIHPWNIVHNANPLDIWVYDPTLEYEPLVYIESSWIYAWNGSDYEDVTANYQSEYSAEIDRLTTEIRNQYNAPITETRIDMLQILVLANKAKLPKEQILTTFLDITDPIHWPGTNPTLTCWLQLARAYAQRDTEREEPFSLPPNESKLNGPDLEEILENINQPKYDLSACETLP